MKKINNKAGVIISGVVLALGILAVPVLAGTDSKTQLQANVPPVTATSQNIKTVADTPTDPESAQNAPNTQATPNDQYYCNSVSTETMQSVYDSTAMQEAMNSPEIKAQLGEDVVNSMNQMMSDENIKAMHSTQGYNMMGSGASSMMNWQ